MNSCHFWAVEFEKVIRASIVIFGTQTIIILRNIKDEK